MEKIANIVAGHVQYGVRKFISVFPQRWTEKLANIADFIWK